MDSSRPAAQRHSFRRIRGALLGSVMGAAAIASGPALAQGVDYRSLRDLFGEPVTTSATGSPQRAREVAANMTILTEEDIRRSGARTIPELLRFVNGVDVWESGNRSYDVGIRGYNQNLSPRLLVLLNGRQVYVDTFSYVQWAAIPVELNEIVQIEVVRGPQSALFGFNAVSGVVNIITKNAAFDTGSFAEIGGGTLGTVEGSAGTIVRLSDKLGLRLSLGGFRAREFENLGRPQEQPFIDDPYRVSFLADLAYSVTPKVQAGLETSYTRVRQNGVTAASDLFGTLLDTFSVRGRVEANTPYGLIGFQAYRNETQNIAEVATFASARSINITPQLVAAGALRAPVGTLGFNPAFAGVRLENQTTVVQLSNILQVGTAHTVRGSLEYRRNVANIIPQGEGEVGFNLWAAGGAWNWRISDKVSTLIAGRIDYLDLFRNGSALTVPFPPLTPALPRPFFTPFPEAAFDDRAFIEGSFNAALVYAVTDLDTIRLTAGRGVQAPSQIEFSLQLGSQTASVASLGNPRIDPTKVLNFGIDYERALPALNATARISGFYARTDDVKGPPSFQSPDFVLRPPGFPASFPGLIVGVFDNIGDSRSLGVEADLRGTVGTTWRWQVNYSFEDVKDDLIFEPVPVGPIFPSLITGLPPGTPSTALGIDPDTLFLARSISFEGASPTHTANLLLGATWGPVSADMALNYHSGYRVPTLVYAPSGTGVNLLGEVPENLILNLRLAYKVNDALEASFAATGLDAAEAVQNPIGQVERRFFFGLTATF